MNIGPGVFLTRGIYSDGYTQSQAPGFRLQDSSQLHGSGKSGATTGASCNIQSGSGTTLKLVRENANNGGVVVASNRLNGGSPNTIADNHNIVVTDLQIDCNAEAIINGRALSLGWNLQGIELNGRGDMEIRNVSVINAVGYNPQVENFIVAINCLTNNSTGNLISSCDVTKFYNPDSQNGQCSAISINRIEAAAGRYSAGYIEGRVEYCTVNLHNNLNIYGGEFAYNATRTRGAVFFQNSSYGAKLGFNNDTPWDENLTIQNNTFEVPGSPLANGGGVGVVLMNGARYSQVTGNTIKLYGPNCQGIIVSYPLLPNLGASDITLNGNNCIATDINPLTPWTGTAIGVNCFDNGNIVFRVDAINNHADGSRLNNLVHFRQGYLSGNTGNGFTTSTATSPTALPAPASIPPVDYGRDANCNGLTDIFLRNGSLQIETWSTYTDGNPKNLPSIASKIPQTWMPSDTWKLVGVADFDRDGVADYIFQDGNRWLCYWLLNCDNSLKSTGWITYPNGGGHANPGGSWDVVAVADLDKDGWPDLIFQDQSNSVAAWHMTGTVFRDPALIMGSLADWRVVGAADLNRDGSVDLVLQNSGVLYPTYTSWLGV